MSAGKMVEAAINNFEEIILKGISFLLEKNETAFLSFMCSLAALDALTGYRYETNSVEKRYKDLIKEYFPSSYWPHAENLYKLRCRMLHNFTPAYFSLVHGQIEIHLTKSAINDYYLCDIQLFDDLKNAANSFFREVRENTARYEQMKSRLQDIERGGAIYVG